MGGALLSRQIIDFTAPMGAVPPEVSEKARAAFEEIADGLAGIPQGSVFWDSVRATQLRLGVRGWSFFYTVDGKRLRIVEVRRDARKKK